MMATGVARPSAQGQLMTRTDMPRASAKATSFPAMSQARKVMTAMPMTAGTNIPETLSASLAMGALVAAASLTICMICARVVSSPTLVALQTRYPDWFIVAAETSSPACLSTGMLSPVRADSSTALMPSTTTPSTGMLSPGFTAKKSPVKTSSTDTSVSTPSTILRAVLGASFIRLLRASVVLPLDLASSILPTVMRVRIIAADSK